MFTTKTSCDNIRPHFPCLKFSWDLNPRWPISSFASDHTNIGCYNTSTSGNVTRSVKNSPHLKRAIKSRYMETNIMIENGGRRSQKIMSTTRMPTIDNLYQDRQCNIYLWSMWLHANSVLPSTPVVPNYTKP
jgi:hypothetical protein